jgi:hypothetical protein
MKKSLLSISAAVIAGFASAQDLKTTDVPSVVLSTFQTSFGNATDVEWELRDNLYKADFELSSVDHDVWLAADGTVKRLEKELRDKDLPTAIRSKIQTELGKFTIDEVTAISEGDKVSYEVDLESSSEDRTVVFSADATILSNKIDE